MRIIPGISRYARNDRFPLIVISMIKQTGHGNAVPLRAHTSIFPHINNKRGCLKRQPLHCYGNEVLEQASDLACFQIQVDIHERGVRGQTGHRAHLSQNRVDESRAYARAHLPHWHRESGGHTFQ